MPPFAYSNRPGRVSVAPVKEPRTWPNSWLSRRVSTSAEQLQTAKRSLDTGLSWCRARAMSSLPAAGGAADQHVGEMAGDFAGQLEDLEHGRTLADDPVKLRVVKELLFEIADLGPLREDGGQLVERFFQAREVDRLGDEVVGAALDGVDGGVHRIEAGDQNDVHAGIELQRFLQEGEPVHRGHFQIAQNHAATAGANFLQSLLRIGGAHHGKTGFVEALGDEVDLVVIIVEHTKRKMLTCCGDCCGCFKNRSHDAGS